MARVLNDVERVLTDHGPALSSTLRARLQNLNPKLSDEAARQKIARAGSTVKRLKGLNFPKGAVFHYLESSFGTDAYWDALLRDMSQSSSAYGFAVSALQARGGMVTRSQFDIICGAPALQKKQLSAQTVLERLLAVRLFTTCTIEEVEYVRFDARTPIDVRPLAELKARRLAEKIMLLAVRDWARKLGIASYNTITLRDEAPAQPKVGTMHWDLAGPSYLLPLATRQSEEKLKPGFFVCDVVAGAELSKATVEAFVHKYKLLASFKNIGRLMPLLLADRYAEDAFAYGRSHGIIIATPETLLGSEVARAITSLMTTLTKAAAMAVERPELIGEFFTKLGSIEGAAGNLRGALFEMLVGHCVQHMDAGSIDIGKLVMDPDSGKQADIDVCRVKGSQEVWCYECKGYQPNEEITEAAVSHWLNDRVPIMHRALRHESRFQNVNLHFEFWTSGRFSPEAEQRLNSAKQTTTRYAIGFKDGAEVRKYIANVRPTTVAKMFDEHFFQHATAKVERKRAVQRPPAVTTATAIDAQPKNEVAF
jgi:hypothetical protein